MDPSPAFAWTPKVYAPTSPALRGAWVHHRAMKSRSGWQHGVSLVGLGIRSVPWSDWRAMHMTVIRNKITVYGVAYQNMINKGRGKDATNSVHKLVHHYIHKICLYICSLFTYIHNKFQSCLSPNDLLFEVLKRHVWILVVNHVIKGVFLRVARDVSPWGPGVDDSAHLRNQRVPLLPRDFLEEPPVPVGRLLAVGLEPHTYCVIFNTILM